MDKDLDFGNGVTLAGNDPVTPGADPNPAHNDEPKDDISGNEPNPASDDINNKKDDDGEGNKNGDGNNQPAGNPDGSSTGDLEVGSVIEVDGAEYTVAASAITNKAVFTVQLEG